MLQRVFIASSSEGLRVAKEVKALLNASLRARAESFTWNSGTFELTKTYIESLEKELRRADFAVLVLTQDDQQLGRGLKQFAPRDNIIFELGLFVGNLGRDRTFYIQPQDLKIPSDLLGVESARFAISKKADLREALRPGCKKIADAICELIRAQPPLVHLSDEQRTRQAELWRFLDQIKGSWWERIRFEGKDEALSFFTIGADEVHSSVSLNGKAYAKDGGVYRAEWRSAAAHLDAEWRRVSYVRDCQRPGEGWRAGHGDIKFDPAAIPNGPIETGRGQFWEINENDRTSAIIKTVELRRVGNAKDEQTMQKGNETEKAKVVRRVLGPRTSVF